MKFSNYSISRKQVFVGSLSLLVPSALLFFEIIKGREVLIALGSLFSTFIGAWFAFQFALKQREAKKEADNISAGNLALFTLAEIWNSLKQYQSQVIDDYRGRYDAWLNMAGTQPLILRDISLNAKDLSFLLDGDASVFQSIFLEEHRFRHAGYIVDRRNELLRIQAWPALAKAGMKLKEQRTEGEIEKILGVNVVQELKITTAAIIKNVDEDEISSKRVFVALRDALIKRFPKGKFIQMNVHQPTQT